MRPCIARPDRRTLLCLPALLLAGCAGGPPTPRPWADMATRELGLSLASFEVLGRRVSMTRHASAAATTPVVVYLPGLGQGGQPNDSGQRWAAAWAQAGYTVLAVQPLETDAAAWRSELSRTGEFRALGQLHYGDALRAERLAALRRLLPALQAAQPALDWTRAALAGYETGAQTALDARADGAWQAVIAISPPAMQSSAAGAATLVVTSEQDHDPLGLLRRPEERRQAFEALAPGTAWLLMLDSIGHAALAGTLAPQGWHEQDYQRSLATAGMAGRGQQRGTGEGPRGPQGGGARGPRSGSATEAAQADLSEALQDSTAFLDARLRGKPLNAPRLQPR